jgi:alpha-tubulin suppressor-like RCC1 family protein
MRRSALLLAPAIVAGLTLAVGSADAKPSPVRGQARTIAVTDDDVLYISGGKVFGVGANPSGEITGAPRTTPSPLAGLPHGVKAVAVSAAGDTTLVLGSNGKAYGAGDSASNQLVDSNPHTTLTPLPGLPKGVKVTQIAEGYHFTLLLGSNGKVYGVGINVYGQLGTSGGQVFKLTAMRGLPKGVKATGIAAGRDASIVLASNHKVYGAGLSSSGELTSVTPPGEGITKLTPFAHLPKGVTFKAAAVSDNNVVLLGSNHWAYATGSNVEGQFGRRADVNPIAHTHLNKLPVSHVVSVAAANNSIGLVRTTGTLVVAGLDVPVGGPGNQVTRFRAVANGSLFAKAKIVEAVLGHDRTLVRNRFGVVLGVGSNAHGELTYPQTTTSFKVLVQLKGQALVFYKAPSITGTVRVGHELKAHIGTLSVRPSHALYQWKRNGHAIAHATKSTYELKSADRGKHVSVTVTVTRSGYKTSKHTSAATGLVSS